MSDPDHRRLPPLRQLGPDLTRLSWRQRATAIALPFVCTGLYIGCAAAGKVSGG